MISASSGCRKDDGGVLSPSSDQSLKSLTTDSDEGEYPTPLSVKISHQDLTLHHGNVSSLRAVGYYPYDVQIDLTDHVVWESSQESIADFVDDLGIAMIEAKEAGAAEISATYKEITGTLALTVAAANLRKIEIDGINENHILDHNADGDIIAEPVYLRARGIYSDHHVEDITAVTEWSSDDETVAIVDADTPGKITFSQQGSTTFTATKDGVAVSITVNSSVREPILTKITSSSELVVIPYGANEAITITGHYSNQTTKDLTGDVSWTSSDEGVATVTTGVVTAKTYGVAVITAAIEELEAKISFQTNAANLLSLTVEPASATLPIGATKAFTATGSYSDGAAYDLTTSVAWSLSNLGIAQISVVSPTKGVFTPNIIGSTDILASFLGKVANASASITAAEVTSISIVAPSDSYPKGRTDNLTVDGTYTDGVTADITGLIEWTSSDPSIVSVNNSNGQKGAISCDTVGAATITASYNGIVATKDIAVTVEVVDSVVVETQGSVPATQAKGLTMQVLAKGTMSDGSIQDVTSETEWSLNISSPGYSFAAVVNNSSGFKGAVTSIQEGTIGIIAVINGKTDTLPFITTKKQPVSVAVTGASNSIALSSTQQMTATVTYTDNTTWNVTDTTSHADLSVVWSASDSEVGGDVITMDNVTNIGEASADLAGAATIKATLTSTEFSAEGPWEGTFGITVTP